MSKISLLIFFLFCSSLAFGQTEPVYNYSIGMRAYTLMQMPKTLFDTNSQRLYHAVANGIMFKFNDNQISLRASGGYFYKDNEEFYNQCESCERGSGNLTDYYFKLGFEKNLNYAVIQPYFGLDIGYRANTFTGEVRSLKPASTTPYYIIERTKTGVLVSPLLGIKFNLSTQFTAHIESVLDFYYTYERRETVVPATGGQTPYFQKYTRLEYLINPVSFGVQFHFGAKD